MRSQPHSDKSHLATFATEVKESNRSAPRTTTANGPARIWRLTIAKWRYTPLPGRDGLRRSTFRKHRLRPELATVWFSCSRTWTQNERVHTARSRCHFAGLASRGLDAQGGPARLGTTKTRTTARFSSSSPSTIAPSPPTRRSPNTPHPVPLGTGPRLCPAGPNSALKIKRQSTVRSFVW
jgi:hypothetical protein